MTEIGLRAAERLPRGLWSAVAIGASAGAVGWWLGGLLPIFTSDYTRLDQLDALVLGAVIGGACLGSRAYRQRCGVAYGVLAGVVLGGVGALCGASLLAFSYAPVGPRWFAVERLAAWMCAAAGSAALLETFAAGRRLRWIRESAAIAALGGATSGAMFLLPGASDVWQAVASVWFGAAVAFAVAGPELWHAAAVIELAPGRRERWHPLLTREWPLHEGMSLSLGEAQIACQHGRVALYPPAGGLTANGHAVRQPRFVSGNALITVGRARYHLQLLRSA